MKGHKTRFIKASHMLGNMAEAEGASALKRWMKKYCSAELLVIDEVGYMNYSPRYADLLYEVISERYQKCSTVVTTNQPFSSWGEIFPHAACVVTLVDRLVHKAEVITIKGESFRSHEAELRMEAKAKERKKKRNGRSIS
jgi:DNA replication protein DnaC